MALALIDSAPIAVDLSQIAPPVPVRKTIMLVNQFVTNTTHFLNNFAITCETKLAKVSADLDRVHIVLALLETKINSIPWLDSQCGPSATPTPTASAGSAVPAGGPPVGPPVGPPTASSGGPPVPPSNGPPVPPAGPPPLAPAEPAPVASGVMLKDDPRYKKYFVMLKVGVAMPQVKNKMELDGLDPSVIERDPMSMSDYVAPPAESDSESEQSDID